MSWGRDSMYSKFCANKLNSHISKDNHMAASQQVSQLHFLYSFQTVPLCELTCIRVYCTVDFDFFTCVFVELYQFMLCNMTVPVLSPLLSVFLSLSWSALCSPPPHLTSCSTYVSVSLSLYIFILLIVITGVAMPWSQTPPDDGEWFFSVDIISAHLLFYSIGQMLRSNELKEYFNHVSTVLWDLVTYPY